MSNQWLSFCYSKCRLERATVHFGLASTRLGRGMKLLHPLAPIH